MGAGEWFCLKEKYPHSSAPIRLPKLQITKRWLFRQDDWGQDDFRSIQKEIILQK
jgi:hypothetical protein